MPETPGGSSAEPTRKYTMWVTTGARVVRHDDHDESVRQFELAHAIGGIGLSRCETLGDQHEPKDEEGKAFTWCPHRSSDPDGEAGPSQFCSPPNDDRLRRVAGSTADVSGFPDAIVK